MSSQQEKQAVSFPRWNIIVHPAIKTKYLPQLLSIEDCFEQEVTEIEVTDVSRDFTTVKFPNYRQLGEQQIDTTLFAALVVCSDKERREIELLYPNQFQHAQECLDQTLKSMFNPQTRRN